MELKAPRGTYDILPAEAQKWQYIEQVMRQTAASFGFQEVRTPTFEHTELFNRGVGETSDIVTKEMYTFHDKSNRSLTLRPEGTASAVRCLIEHGIYSGILPVKWFYHGPMFRYDRPQAGRYRQFHQFGVEAFGSPDPFIDAEIINLMLEILRQAGLEQYELHLNSVGCPSCRQTYRDKLISHLLPQAEGLCKDCRQRYNHNPLRVLDCKEEPCRRITDNAPVIIENLCGDCSLHYQQVKEALTMLGISYQHDDHLVRGLDYYTKTAFEVHLPGIGAQSAIGGGGRYDGLVRECGGPELPGVGFALGMERLLAALEHTNQELILPPACDVFVTAMNPACQGEAFRLLQELRQAGFKADKDYMNRSPKAQMKQAGRAKVRAALLIGDDELKNGTVTIRNMKDSQQETVPREILLDRISILLAVN